MSPGYTSAATNIVENSKFISVSRYDAVPGAVIELQDGSGLFCRDIRLYHVIISTESEMILHSEDSDHIRLFNISTARSRFFDVVTRVKRKQYWIRGGRDMNNSTPAPTADDRSTVPTVQISVVDTIRHMRRRVC